MRKWRFSGAILVASLFIVAQYVLAFFVYKLHGLPMLQWFGWGIWIISLYFGFAPMWILGRRGGVAGGKSYVHTTRLASKTLACRNLTSPHLRLTRQRKLVLTIIQESQEHLDADSIYRRAKLHDLHIGLATVYRALAFFIKEGLVIEHQLGEDHRHYEPVKTSPHYHFTCKIGFTKKTA